MPVGSSRVYKHGIESLLGAHACGFSSSAPGAASLLPINATEAQDLQIQAARQHGVGFGRQLYFLTGRAVKTMLRNPFSTYAMLGQTVSRCCGRLSHLMRLPLYK